VIEALRKDAEVAQGQKREEPEAESSVPIHEHFSELDPDPPIPGTVGLGPFYPNPERSS
jgi:hypothetical protein